MRGISPTHRAECFTNGQRGAAIGQPDFDDDASTFGDECVTQDVAFALRQRHTIEVARERPGASWTSGVQLRPDRAHPLQPVFG
jgi:hypothetical protein